MEFVIAQKVQEYLHGWRWPNISRMISPEVFYRFCANGLARIIWHPYYFGFEHIPAIGAGILVSNHVSYVDGMIINAAVKRPVRYVIDEDIYNLLPVRQIMKHNRAIPIAPNRASVEKALDEISDGLRAGDLICIFPEGLLTYTGSLGRFKAGVEHMVHRDPVPVYPIALHGLWGSIFSRKDIGSWKRFLPRRFGQRTLALCGTPIPPEQVTINYLQEVVLKLKYSLSAIAQDR